MLGLTASLLICHFLADFTHLSRPWMLKAKATGKPVFPIFCHAAVHTTLMALVLITYKFIRGINDGGHEVLIFPALALQLVSHTLIDTLKGYLNLFEGFRNPASQWHWIIFGADQVCHQLIILWMVYLCIS